MLNGLDLFSGIGGMSVALRQWIKPIAYCEIDPYCQGVLLSRISDGSLPNAPIWDNIETLSYDGRNWPGVDIIYGGFPCQDISIAGYGKGLEGEHSGLFFEIIRLAKEIKPKFLFIENVPAITNRGGLQVVNEIAEMGYDCRWCTISAKEIGAIHKRERWFLLANSNSKSGPRLPSGEEKVQPLSKLHSEYKEYESFPENESTLLGMDDGIPHKLDRTKCLGNAVVPDQAKKAFKILMGK